LSSGIITIQQRLCVTNVIARRPGIRLLDGLTSTIGETTYAYRHRVLSFTKSREPQQCQKFLTVFALAQDSYGDSLAKEGWLRAQTNIAKQPHCAQTGWFDQLLREPSRSAVILNQPPRLRPSKDASRCFLMAQPPFLCQGGEF